MDMESSFRVEPSALAPTCGLACLARPRREFALDAAGPQMPAPAQEQVTSSSRTGHEQVYAEAARGSAPVKTGLAGWLQISAEACAGAVAGVRISSRSGELPSSTQPVSAA